ncbi:iron(III) transport system ATP-binding protein [Formivibrio citricus]|uniref:Iron(III) transport system ATP-binding protein n=1 Tax=Formivibrio citricus TaxID=83765 RepID=A0A1I5CQ04_9NEIS|nr:ABC transporter ATP-binding protein [Formivibrio citricus]SFN89013.1 iron(III) transport system ATP-binding protein [Formivibrio citricus]
MALLEIDQLAVSYNGNPVVSGLALQLEEGEIGCLLGASGCGKTTVLRAVAGFEPVRGGTIRLAGATVGAPGRSVPPEQRRVGMVFQDYALFPHLDIAANVGFGLGKMNRAGRAERVRAMLALVGLEAMAQRYPHELSGGQQQRAALARALAPSPQLILLDEPFSNLDAELREKLAQDVRAILKAAGTTALLVTHDQHEAFAMADRVGVMHAGQIRQWSTPYDLYHRPMDRFVADFIGEGAWLAAEVNEAGEVTTELGVLNGIRCAEDATTRQLDVLIRPDDLVHDDTSPQKARVLARAFRGAEFLYTLALPSGQRLLSLVASHHNHRVGEEIGIRLETDHLISFSRQ